MQHFSSKPAEAYRRVDLDARIEASSGQDLTLICLEEVVSALGQALLAMERKPGQIPTEPLARAHGIAVWLARSVSPENPLHQAMTQFYGGLAATIARNLAGVSVEEITRVRGDFADLLSAAQIA